MNDVFVVEGIHDKNKLERVLEKPNVVITNGSEISKTTIEEIKLLSKNNRIVLLLDPDGPGEKIRRKIQDEVENTVSVYIKKDDSISKNKKKVGVEHVADEVLIEALKDYKNCQNYTDITVQDLARLKLNGSVDAKVRRQKICDIFNIGYASSKTLIYKFKLFGITKKELLEKIKELDNE